jgi:arginyl-tRNA synthetase
MVTAARVDTCTTRLGQETLMTLASHKTLRAKLASHVQTALSSLFGPDALQGSVPSISLVRPKQAAHGDWCCTAALALAKAAKQNPRALAEKLKAALGDAGGMLEKTEIAGPGYLNLTVHKDAWRAVLRDVLAQDSTYICTQQKKPTRILLEYVSANPTGPLHVAHGRGAVTGDVIANLLRAAGYQAEREYYINDLGHQADVLARSIHLRYRQLFGQTPELPEDFYPGDYIIQAAQALKDQVGDAYLTGDEDGWIEPVRSGGMAAMMVRIRSDLEAFGIGFDHYVSERAFIQEVGLEAFLARLEKTGHTYRQDGKLWFRSTSFGDDKDRVLMRDDGRPTYFASDIAYHDHKFQRGFDRLINVWGADHGGYLARIKAGLTALGHDADRLQVIFIQMVSLSRDGAAVRMGKRLGTAVWLREVVEEAGRDATRYLFVSRRADAQMDFDITLATKRSIENPVYYAQMGHARLASIERKAAQAGMLPQDSAQVDLTALRLPEEFDLLRTLSQAPDVVADAAEAMEPHQVVHYVQGLIAQFHSYYSQYKNTQRVISDDVAVTHARILLCRGLRVVLASLLGVLGVAAPESMYLADAIQDLESTDAASSPGDA